VPAWFLRLSTSFEENQAHDLFSSDLRTSGDLGEETRRLLAEDHGETNWQTVLRRNCAAWFRIADSVQRPDEDLYDGRLGELQVPTLFLHGSLDPRTEPGEMDRVRQALPRATMQFIATGKHSPHSEEDSWQECNTRATEFFRAPLDPAIQEQARQACPLFFGGLRIVAQKPGLDTYAGAKAASSGSRAQPEANRAA